MALTLRDLVDHTEFGLRWVTGPERVRARSVLWVAVTELADPGRFLSGGELVLTTGLRQDDRELQAQFVRQVAEAGAAGIGFGIGLSHPEVPAATVEAAVELGVPLIEVPYRTPFLAIDRYVADRVLSDHYGRSRNLLETYDELAAAVLSDSGPGRSPLVGMLSRLHRAVAGPVAVIGPAGQVLASVPADANWPIAAILGAGGARELGAVSVLPVELAGVVGAFLVARRPRRLVDVLPYAVALIGLELARGRAVLEGRRDLLGQVLTDVVAGALDPDEAVKRLAPFGIDVAESNTVIIGTVPGRTADQVRRAAAGPLAHAAAVTAWCDGALVTVVRGFDPAPGAAAVLAAHLQPAGAVPAVGVGGRYPGVAGLRWSYREAVRAMTGPGVHQRSGLSMTGLVMVSQDLPLRELAADTLRPLRSYDVAHDGALVRTLAAYLDLDGSVARVADRLVLHRNTVRYRLAQITELTGRGVDRTEDRLHWFLALLADPTGAA